MDRPVLRAAGHRALFASAVTVLVLALHTVHVRTAAASGAAGAAPGVGPSGRSPSAGPLPVRSRAPVGPARPSTTAANPAASPAVGAVTGAVPSAATGSGGAVFVVGDSLALGSAPYLHTAFGHASVTQDLREGRGTAEGARIVASRAGSAVIVASLGTNDDPRTQIFKPAADALVAAAHGRCLIWATVLRPGDVDGTRWTNVNAIIRAEAAEHPNIVVVDWASDVAAHPAWVEGDAVHLTDAGYRARAAALASGVTRCG